MVSHDFLPQAIEVCHRTRGTITAIRLRRAMRVGPFTGIELIFALEDAGVLGERQAGGVYRVLERDVKAAQLMVEWAILDGRIALTVPWLNDQGVPYAEIKSGRTVRMISGDLAQVVRLDLPRLGVIELLEPGAHHAAGERAIFHAANVAAIVEV